MTPVERHAGTRRAATGQTGCSTRKHARSALHPGRGTRLTVGQTSTARQLARGSFSNKVRVTFVVDEKVLKTSGGIDNHACCRDATVSCFCSSGAPGRRVKHLARAASNASQRRAKRPGPNGDQLPRRVEKQAVQFKPQTRRRRDICDRISTLGDFSTPLRLSGL